jgi:hypothetical protein
MIIFFIYFILAILIKKQRNMENEILHKPIEQLMVITNGNVVAITEKKCFQEHHKCKTFNKEGKLIGCYNAGCNTLMENSNGLCGNKMWNFLLEDLEKEFAMEIPLNLEKEDNIVISNPSSYSEIIRQKICKYIEVWKKDNEVHEKINAFNFNNGKKYQTYYLVDSIDSKDDFYWMKVDKEKSEIILKELISKKIVNKFDDFEIIESVKYTFTKYYFLYKPFAWYVSENKRI